MVGIHEMYTSEMYDKLGFLACWLPNMKLALGDVGTLAGRRFERVTSLGELGVAFDVGEVSSRADLEYSSADKVETGLAVAAGAVGVGDGNLSVTFGDAGATLIQAAQCRWESVTNHPALERELQVQRLAGRWRPDWVVITKVLRTGPAAIMVSNVAGARVNLRLSAEALAGPLPLAHASAALMASSASGLAARVAVRGGATPFFGAMSFRRQVFGRARLRWRSGEAAEQGVPVAAELEDVGWERFVGEA